jgi:hypothetical protein
VDIQAISDLIKNFGFPITVAIWALWRLDKSWGKGQSSLNSIEESLDRVEEILQRNTEIQTELVTTIKIIQTIIGGELRK